MDDIRKLPIGIQSFEDLRRNHYLYVDKTAYVWNLISTGKVYFLSRPRRFGKSLLISTLEAYFLGKSDLFDGLFIKAKEDAKGGNAWLQHPVVHFSLSGGDYHSENGLEDALNNVIEGCCRKYHLTGNYEIYGETLPIRFKTLIEQLYAKTGRQVVVLVDEYDKPLLETMTVNETQEEHNRRLYKGFFSVLKDEDRYLKFVFFTGVTKFSKISVFSDLNQLKDISLTNAYAEICGITQKEMSAEFKTEIRSMAGELGLTEEECLRKLAEMYDGYHFSAKSEGVYNPFSLLNAFQDRDFGSYWFGTGTPGFLIQKLRYSSFTPEQITDGVEATEQELTDYQSDNPNPIPLFYQSGYLTICGFDREFRIYSLKFPNEEVKYGFLKGLAPEYLGNKDAENPVSLKNMIWDLRKGAADSFLQRLSSLFAGIPYPEGRAPEYEQEWRNQIFLIFALLGQNVKCEVHSAQGRADAVVETKNFVYIFEFKVDQSADEALRQIEEKGYATPYLTDSRKIQCIGVSFSSQKRNIKEWKMVEAKAG
jgi:hypothetical protein